MKKHVGKVEEPPLLPLLLKGKHLFSRWEAFIEGKKVERFLARSFVFSIKENKKSPFKTSKYKAAGNRLGNI